ncbi:unnamed protein product [Eruca vesicaria subsp. sativa]|uniref:Uncharacterized protein n=1 Tax=Eruca vesicaria subsp. sativa TaxID=29727 RepID=A0ABC8M5U8_ERUVS|nr:unnamed protein product [Eruca vesicaria subsp. sativa]
MKRKRCEMEEATKKKKITEIGSAIEELSVLSIAKTTIVTTETEATNIINLPLKPLLSFCKLIIQIRLARQWLFSDKTLIKISK